MATTTSTSRCYGVTPEQAAKAHKFFDSKNHPFWLVESESQVDENGRPVEYKVTFDNGWHCTCPSGKDGFKNVQHPSGTCKHCRWAAASDLEEPTTSPIVVAEREAERIARQRRNDEQARRDRAPLNGNKGFQLMR